MREIKMMMAIALGSIMLFSGMANAPAEQIEEEIDELDPMGYAASGYYGISQEELKELLPGLEYDGEPYMILESRLSDTVSCKQVFYFSNNELAEIQYHYLFDVGEDAERKFIKHCARLRLLDPNSDSDLYLGDLNLTLDWLFDRNLYFPHLTKLYPINSNGLFWKKIVQYSHGYNGEVKFKTFCDLENSKGINRNEEPEGWKNEYRIDLQGYFYHWYVDWEKLDGGYCTDEDIERSNASFLGGKEAQILLRIATWD